MVYIVKNNNGQNDSYITVIQCEYIILYYVCTLPGTLSACDDRLHEGWGL